MSKEYNKYLQEHRANVAKAFYWMQTNVPHLMVDDYEIQITTAHDKSKSDPEEYGAYDQHFYGKDQSHDVELAYQKAWLNHIHSNPHHWQHWILNNDDPNEGEILLDIPYNYIVEMICDWWSFSWFKGNLLEIFSWYEEHKNYIKLHPNTRKLVEDILSRIQNKLGEVMANEINR